MIQKGDDGDYDDDSGDEGDDDAVLCASCDEVRMTN